MVEQWSSKSYAWVRVLLSLLVHLVKKKKLSNNNNIKIKSFSFKSVKKLYSELLLTSKKRLNSKKPAIPSKLTSLRFTNILANFQNLERFKVSKNNFFSFYFNLNSVFALPLNKFCQSTLNIFIVQGLFYLTRTDIKSLQNTLLSPSLIDYSFVPILGVTKLNLLFSHKLYEYNSLELKQNMNLP